MKWQREPMCCSFAQTKGYLMIDCLINHSIHLLLLQYTLCHIVGATDSTSQKLWSNLLSHQASEGCKSQRTQDKVFKETVWMWFHMWTSLKSRLVFDVIKKQQPMREGGGAVSVQLYCDGWSSLDWCRHSLRYCLSSRMSTLRFGQHLIKTSVVILQTELSFALVNRKPVVPGRIFFDLFFHVKKLCVCTVSLSLSFKHKRP